MVSVGTPEIRTPWKIGRKLEDNIKINLQGTEWNRS
jgi:hypothetical protein